MPGGALSMFPLPNDGDSEDVAWALSTAEALWKRGEYTDAIGWVRKAATAASEADQDLRVVELAKAAAELSAIVDAFGEKQKAPEPKPATPEPPSADGIDIDLDVEPEASAPPPAPAPTPAAPLAARPPAKPPQRPPPRPIPNANPTPLTRIAVDAVAEAAKVEEPLAPPPPAPPAPPSSHDPESMQAMPSVPPEPPDFAPTPMAMPVAKSVPPPAEPPPPRPPQLSTEGPPATRSARTSTAPFGSPMPGETPSLADVALGFRPAPNQKASPFQHAPPPAFDDDATQTDDIVPPAPAIEVPQRPGVISPMPPRPALSANATVPDAPKSRPMRASVPPPAPLELEGMPPAPPIVPRPRSVPPPPRLGTPPMGSVPPPKVSLVPSALPSATGDDGVQSHVSDAPPRVAQSSSVHIPAAPKAPSLGPGGVPTRPSNAPGRVATMLGFPSEPPASSAAAKPSNVRMPPQPAIQHKPALQPQNTPSVSTIVLDPDRFEVLADVPDDARAAMAQAAERVVLLPDEAVPAPAMVIVLTGELEVRAKGYVTRLDAIGAGQVRLLVPFAPAEGELEIVGGSKGARFLSLDVKQIEALRAAAPWVVQELEPASDDVHVVAGALRGKHGRRLDGGILDALLARAKTMRLGPDAKVVKQGEAVRALILLGAGRLSLRSGAESDAPEIGSLSPGDILFATELLGRLPAPATVRAGPEGAMVIVATRAATEELLVTVSPLLEILGEG